MVAVCEGKQACIDMLVVELLCTCGCGACAELQSALGVTCVAGMQSMLASTYSRSELVMEDAPPHL